MALVFVASSVVETTAAMKASFVLLIAGVLLVAYCTPFAVADDEEEPVDEAAENGDADDDGTDGSADDDADDSGDEEGISGDSRRAAKGVHARAGHMKHARAGSRNIASRAGSRPHARSGAARRAAHSK
ncbi:uncharacterized protein LOC124805195 [Schistocerca piceifrons]|uniref:uncharacterized protein LOC124805195 n=1 Tax=Schistocerca piceifrons TaxID=274613 RepID=UPI001F5F1A83|nr:uncharacterized protein LOC124805195 [Schistocerca piceifrons]